MTAAVLQEFPLLAQFYDWLLSVDWAYVFKIYVIVKIVFLLALCAAVLLS